MALSKLSNIFTSHHNKVLLRSYIANLSRKRETTSWIEGIFLNSSTFLDDSKSWDSSRFWCGPSASSFVSSRKVLIYTAAAIDTIAATWSQSQIAVALVFLKLHNLDINRGWIRWNYLKNLSFKKETSRYCRTYKRSCVYTRQHSKWWSSILIQRIVCLNTSSTFRIWRTSFSRW